MSDPTMRDDDLHPDDELVSAVLDGEATPEEVARVARHPELAARRSELQAAADAVAAPVEPLAASVLDDLLATAMAATPSPSAATAEGHPPPDERGAAAAAGGATVVELTDRRRGTSPGRWLAVAAAVLVALALPLALTLSSDDEHPRFASVGSAISDDGLPVAGGLPDGIAEESSRAIDREADGLALDEAQPSTTMAPFPSAPAADAATSEGATAMSPASAVPWLGWFGTVPDGVDLAERLASAAAAALPGTFPPPAEGFHDDGTPVMTSEDLQREAAARCTDVLLPGGRLLGVGTATVDRGGSTEVVSVLVIAEPTEPVGSADAQVLVVRQLTERDLSCGEVLAATTRPG